MVYIKNYDTSDTCKSHNLNVFNKNEIKRYCGVPSSAKDKISDDLNSLDLDRLIDECIDELKDKLVYKVCYEKIDIKKEIINNEKILDLGFAETKSKNLDKYLTDCDKIILFAATIGLAADRLIARYGVLSPVKAAIFQSVGAERVEALCDEFCEDIKDELDSDEILLTSRFSAGYGDFPLEVQRDIFKRLDCHRKIGLTLNDSMLMSPSKSVTAIVGIKNNSKTSDTKDNNDCYKKQEINKCALCSNTQCQYREV